MIVLEGLKHSITHDVITYLRMVELSLVMEDLIRNKNACVRKILDSRKSLVILPGDGFICMSFLIGVAKRSLAGN